MITFTRTTRTQGSNGHVTSVETTITGSAIQKRGDPERVKDLGLTLETSITFLFTPTNYELMAQTDEFVMVGDTVEWNGKTYTVKSVEPVAPDGFVIIAYIIVSA